MVAFFSFGAEGAAAGADEVDLPPTGVDGLEGVGVETLLAVPEAREEPFDAFVDETAEPAAGLPPPILSETTAGVALALAPPPILSDMAGAGEAAGALLSRSN